MQLTILSESYPRHIIEFFSQRGRETMIQSAGQMGDLARSHDGVTVLCECWGVGCDAVTTWLGCAGWLGWLVGAGGL